MDATPLHDGPRPDQADRLAQAGMSVDDRPHGCREAPGDQVVEAALPGRERLAAGTEVQSHELLLAIGKDRDHAQDRDAHDLPRTPDPQGEGVEVEAEDVEIGKGTVRRLRDTGLFTRVVNLSETEFPAGTGRALRLRGSVTRLGRGSQAARYLVGFGAGSTRAQAEMHFVDAQSGRVWLVTADRRLGSIGLFGGNSEDFLKESFDDMARDFAKFLVRLSKGEAPAKE